MDDVYLICVKVSHDTQTEHTVKIEEEDSNGQLMTSFTLEMMSFNLAYFMFNETSRFGMLYLI